MSNSSIKEVVDFVRTELFDVNHGDHCNKHTENNDSVKVGSNEGSLKSSCSSVQDHSPGNKEGCQLSVHSGQSLYGRCSSEQKHRSHNDIGAEAKEEESLVRSASPTSVNNLRKGMCRRSNLLERNSEYAEKKNLNGSSRRVPERSRNSILPSNVGRLEKSSCPSPLRNNNGCSKTSLYRTSSSAVRGGKENGCCELGHSTILHVYQLKLNHFTHDFILIMLSMRRRWKMVDVRFNPREEAIQFCQMYDKKKKEGYMQCKQGRPHDDLLELFGSHASRSRVLALKVNKNGCEDRESCSES